MPCCSTIRPHFPRPILNAGLQKNCSSTILEQSYTQIQIDTIDSVEARLGNKSLLLKGLPSMGFTTSNLDWNTSYFCELGRFHVIPFPPWPTMSLMPAPAFFGRNSSQRTTSQPSTTSSSRTSSNRLPTSRSTFKFEPDVSTRLAFYTLLAIQATPARRRERPPGPSTVRH